MNSSGLGQFLREQRSAARLSLRQLAEAAGVSNPYLSQIERGLRRPSADVLQHIAQGLQISAEALYQRAGLLDQAASTRTRDVLQADTTLDPTQRTVLVALYDHYRDQDAGSPTATTHSPHATEGETMTRMEDLVDDVVEQLKKNLGESTTFYAAAGLADMVAQRLRDAGAKAEEAGRRAQAKAGDFSRKAQEAAREGFDPSKLQQTFEGLPSTLISRALDVAGKAEGLFSDLASHGKDVVDRHTKDRDVVKPEDAAAPAPEAATAEAPAPEPAEPLAKETPAEPKPAAKPRATKPRTTKPRTTKPRATKPKAQPAPPTEPETPPADRTPKE